MGLIVRALRVALTSMIVASVASAAWAVVARRRFVPRGDADSDEIEIGAFYGDLAFRSTARRFRYGHVVCGYGGGVLDFSAATLDPAGARLDVVAVYGGGQIIVPESWRVRVRARSLFGGVADARPRIERPAGAPELTIGGFALFGGFAIQPAAQAPACAPETAPAEATA